MLERGGMDKLSIGWLAGPLGHVGVNIAGGAAHHGSNLADVLAHRGLQHALTGSRINPVAERMIKAFAGPESLIPYQAAHSLGSKLKDLPTDKLHASLRASLQSHTGQRAGTAIGDAPVLGPLHRALQHELAGTQPEYKAKGVLAKAYGGVVHKATGMVDTPFDTTTQRVARGVVAAAPGAALSVADPVGTAAHVGLNSAREVLGRSSIGGVLRRNLLEKGLEGSKINPLKEHAINTLVSPALLDPHRIGMAGHAAGASKEIKGVLEKADQVKMLRSIKNNPPGQVQQAPGFMGGLARA